MKHNLPILLLALLLGCVFHASARTELLKRFDQFTVPKDTELAKLIDKNVYTVWDSNHEDITDNHDGKEGHYIQVRLDDADLALAADESIVIYVQRSPYGSDQHDANNTVCCSQPTAIRILGNDTENADEGAWHVLAHAYLVYRGPKTHEYSARIHPEGLTRLPRHLRFVVTANNNRFRCANHGVRVMRMAEFNVIKLKNDEDYTDTQKDRFRLKTDYVDYYKKNNFRFEHTLGVLDPHNQGEKNGQNYKTVYGGHNHYDANGRWTADREFWDTVQNFAMPLMNYITPANDTTMLVKQGVRQRSHVTEHELYAVPGDMIALYPYYSLPKDKEYKECFSHWYDYETGGDNDYLDFLIDPARVAPLPGHGFVAGENLPSPDKGDNGLYHPVRFYGTVGTFFMPRNPYENDEGHLQTFHDICGKDEFTIAADFAYEFNKDGFDNLDLEGGVIYEPTVNFRHIFHIRDGKKFADENMATRAANRAWVRKNRRYVTARAGDPFQLRFDSPVPAQQTTRSKWYYKESESDYRRICTMDLEVIDADTGEKLQSTAADDKNPDSRYFYASGIFYGEGERTVDGITYYDCGGGSSYYRMLKCNAAHALVGRRYIVRLIAKDINGHRIHFPQTEVDDEGKALPDSDQEVWVQEYYISFMPSQNASLLTDDELAEEEHKLHRPQTLEQRFGKPMDKIDYDELMPLFKDEKKQADYFYTLWNGNPDYGLKWPMSWDQASYAFPYTINYDYNAYKVTNNGANTSHHGGLGQNGNLYDRRYYDHGKDESERGFMYYVNAAADPGTMAYLRLNEFCSGTTLYVSAWMADLSGQQPSHANISFNFEAVVDKYQGGVKVGVERIPIHSFVSGSISEQKQGIWHHVYYAFEPDISRMQLDHGVSTRGEAPITRKVNHYEITLENNAENSHGADYVVDDIRVYVSRPEVYAKQITPVCDEETAAAPVKIWMPFDMALQSVGIEEAVSEKDADTHRLYYTILDKAVFDTVYNHNDDNYLDAFNASLVHFAYRGDEARQNFGMVTFSDRFLSNPDYTKYGRGDYTGQHAYSDRDGAMHLLAFNAQPSGPSVRPGRDYYVVLYTPLEHNDTTTPGPLQFKLNDHCSKYGIFSVEGASQVVVDGVAVQDAEALVVCENQAPVVQVRVMAYNEKTDSLEYLDRFTPMDWYLGSAADFMAEQMVDGRDTLSLREVLLKYRHEFPEENDLWAVKLLENGLTTDSMLVFLQRLATPRGDTPARLRMGGHSFAFPSLKIPEGSTEGEARVVAVPMAVNVGDSLLVCTAPTEIRIKVANRAPELYHGLAEIRYPGYLTDVPLRVGHRQMTRVSAEQGSDPGKYLYLPVRRQVPVTPGVTTMTVEGVDPNVYLVETDDPAYENILQAVNASDQIMRAVGELHEIRQVAGGLPVLRFSFYSDAITFREGYTYRLRYNFREAVGSAAAEQQPCEGQDVFTLKIVPEYQAWTGDCGPNYNNDRNWRRVEAKKDLLSERHPDRETIQLYVNIANGNTRSFVPLDFTKTIIPKPVNYLGADTLSLRLMPDLHASGDTLLRAGLWSTLPGDSATLDIRFDMASRDSLGTDVYCRPWLANECEQIHFDSGAWIGSQQHLRYEKAWVDFEFDPDRWYILSSPLQDTRSADMYMPTYGARQLTEKFRTITFDFGAYNRFAPAVFQRSWDKQGQAVVYELGGGSHNVAVRTAWSHVYNDVAEEYSAGKGFSVKADLSDPRTYRFPDQQQVLMRLPKADKSVLYYDESGNQTGNATPVHATDSLQYRLHTGVVRVPLDYSNGRYAIVGNPYMCHLDMRAFFAHNADTLGLIDPAYWLMNESRPQAAVYNKETGLSGTVDNAAILPPMQGFFVHAADGVQAPYVEFTPAMMLPGNTPHSLIATRADAAQAPTLLLQLAPASAGRTASAAALLNDPRASRGYDPGEDAVLLFDDTYACAQVYTAAGNTAAVVNATPDADGVEVGVLSTDPDSEHVLTFTGVNAFPGLRLFDAVADTYTPLEEGLHVRVPANTPCRYFLVRDLPLQATDQELHIDLTGSTVTVVSTASGADIAVDVCDVAGHRVRSLGACGARAEFTLDPGLYIIQARDGFGRRTLKALVK